MARSTLHISYYGNQVWEDQTRQGPSQRRTAN